MRVGQLLAEPGIDRTAWIVVEYSPTMVIAVDTHTYEVYRWIMASVGRAIIVHVRSLVMDQGTVESYWQPAQQAPPPAVLTHMRMAHLRGER